MPRRVYIDWARGIAVLVMIEAHALDAWTRAADRHGILFRDGVVLGGFAAPLFLWLAGLAVVLAATRAATRPGAVLWSARARASGAEVACRRGLEIFILAFLFRLQSLIITPGGAPVTLFRVDVLNIMGPSMVGVGLLWGAARTTAGRVTLCALMAAAIGMLTPIVRATSLVDALPIWFQWYVRPTGDLTIFTMFPWAGFVFAGGAAGALLAETRDERAERRLHVALGAAGVALIVAGFYAAGRPTIYRASSFWTSSPTWFAIRLGILTVTLSVIYGLFRVAQPSGAARAAAGLPDGLRYATPAIDPLARLGRASLFVYWIHVELVYGYATWLIRGRLPIWGTALAYVAFCALMYGAIVLRDRLVDSWRARRVGPTPQPARQTDATTQLSA